MGSVKMYSIGEISKQFNLPISTIRYYDKEGLLLNIKRDSNGIRKFDETDIRAIQVIECLKKSGMQLKDIKVFMKWCDTGDSSLENRKEMFYKRKEDVENQMKELQKVLDFVNYKCWYYETACKEKTEKRLKNITPQDMPENIRILYNNSHC